VKLSILVSSLIVGLERVMGLVKSSMVILLLLVVLILVLVLIVFVVVLLVLILAILLLCNSCKYSNVGTTVLE
jgi:hypothetical protein